MKLNVLSVAYPFAPVGARAVGGAEQVLSTVEASLVARGHRSIVVARDGSLPAGRLLATAVPEGIIDVELRDRVTQAHQANIDFALRTYAVDVVHMHGIDFHRYTLPPAMPVLVTLHLPPSWYPAAIWSLPPNYHLQCVSEAQRKACPPSAQERVLVVNNGVAIPDAAKLPKRRDYALMLSRICPEKNLHEGLDAARHAHVPVLLAGETFPYEEHLRYAREQVEPRLGERARFLGPVFGAEKSRLLARARCLLLPTIAPETSSLVAMEAIAMGTPVIAFRSGALPEIVEDGRTGFLVRDTVEMAAAIARVGEIDPDMCRAIAADRFSDTRMVDAYVECYHRLVPQQREVGGEENVSPVEAPTREVVSTLAGLEDLQVEWTTLWKAEQRATPFQSPEWLIPWWKHVGEGELFVVTLRDDRGALAGLLPLYLYTQPANGERHLLLLGAGTSDYLDGLFPAGTHSSAGRLVGAAIEYIEQQQERWDRCILHQLRASSHLLVWARERDGNVRERDGNVFDAEACSSLAVDSWAQLPAKIRANSGRYRRRAEARGVVTYRIASTPSEALDGLDALISLQTKRWTVRGEAGVLASDRVQRHHRESVVKLQEAGLLRMFSLALNGEVIAVLYALIDAPRRSESTAEERRLYCYLIGFDTEYADISPGTLLLSYAFDTCLAEEIARLDMLRGGEGYKELWGASYEATYGFSL